MQAGKSARTFPGVVRIALLTITTLFVWSIAAEASWNVVMYDNRRYVPLEDVATFYKMNTPVMNGKKFRIATTGRSIEGSAEGRDIFINGVKYVLCFPIATKNGKSMISAMDVVKIIEPILRPQKIKDAGAVRTVILDAGHGGHDSGARGPLGAEKDATLDVVLRAKKLLQESGYQVRCTRLTDTFIPLEKRAEFANKHTNAIFVSVHFNKSNTGGGTGLETYCLAPRGVPSMDEENLRYSDFVQYAGHAKDAENVALATTVHASLVRTLGLTDRGIKRARFVVIKNVTVPGILVEGGFMSGAPDYKLIATPDYRQKMAQSIVDGINRYKQAVSGEVTYQRPSAVATATDPTTVPSLTQATPTPAPSPAPVGEKSSRNSSVVKAQDALETSIKGN